MGDGCGKEGGIGGDRSQEDGRILKRVIKQILYILKFINMQMTIF